RHRRRSAARAGPGDGRDDRGGAGDRLVARDHVAPVRPRLQHARGHREPVRRGFRRVPRRAAGDGRAPVRLHDHHQPDRAPGRGAQRQAQEGGLMAVVTEQPSVDLREPAGWRRTKNRIATVLMVLSFVVVIIPLGFVLYTVIAKGASVLGWSFLTSQIPPAVVPGGTGGSGAAGVGTRGGTAPAPARAAPPR